MDVDGAHTTRCMCLIHTEHKCGSGMVRKRGECGCMEGEREGQRMRERGAREREREESERGMGGKGKVRDDLEP